MHPQWLVARYRREQLAWLRKHARGAVLDVGCAGGGLAAVLEASSYVGLDYPVTAIELYGTRPHVFGDAHCLPFADGTFDTVLMLDVLEHLSDPGTALGEAARVLKSDGKIVLVVPFAYPLHDEPHDYQRYTRHGLKLHLHTAGVSVTAIEEAGDGISVACSLAAMMLAQGAIAALAGSTWRVVLVPFVALLIPMVNLGGALLSRLLPSGAMLPGAYFLTAQRMP